MTSTSPNPSTSPNAARPGKKPFLATTPGLVLACLGACLLWGSAFPCVKIGYGLFGIDSADVPTIIAFAGERFLISGALVVLGMSIARRRPFVPARRDWAPAAKLSIFQTILQYLFFYVGLSRCAGVTSSIIEASNSFLIVLLAAFVFRTETMSGKKALGCALGFAGVLMVKLGDIAGGSLSLRLDGEGLVFLSTFAAATSSNLCKRYAAAGHDPVLLSGWQFVIGGAVMLAVGAAMGGHVAPSAGTNPIAAYALLAYLGFISAAAYSLWSAALAANPASRVAVFGFMNPVFGAILSAILLGETNVLNPALAVAALALVSAGIVVVNRPDGGRG
ncbi:DMT family transporter [Paratractidigestivibacter sp.]|uniref:DMT family transporter n=1 Tax=Paratractidigestivibacter sp. TaxID=2847316 RepID=UPI002AC8B532|nr:DMT family transporter [Paratractidigestivibacter sp.]